MNEAKPLTSDDVWQLIESLPEDHEMQVEFALQTLKETLEVLEKQRRLTQRSTMNTYICVAEREEKSMN